MRLIIFIYLLEQGTLNQGILLFLMVTIQTKTAATNIQDIAEYKPLSNPSQRNSIA